MTASISTLIFSFLSLIIASGIFGSYLGSGRKSKKLKRLYIFFALFSVYQLCFSYFFFFDNLYFAAWAYNLAVVIVFAMIALIFGIIMDIFDFTLSGRRLTYALIIFVGASVSAVQIYDLHFPIVEEDGIVNWNANVIAARATSLSVFFVSLTWVYGILKNFSAFEYFSQKAKAIFLSSGGLFLGLSGLTTYHSYEREIAIISHIFAFVGGFLILATLLIYDKNKEK